MRGTRIKWENNWLALIGSHLCSYECSLGTVNLATFASSATIEYKITWQEHCQSAKAPKSDDSQLFHSLPGDQRLLLRRCDVAVFCQNY